MKSKVGCLLGNVFYYYHSSLFGWAAPFMAATVFPDQGGLAALFYIYAFLPLKHVARPLGAVVWGWLGDWWGRKPVLSICLVGMAIATIGISFIPTGGNAGLILGCLCVLQGFFAAGEAKSSGIYLLEQSPPEKRTWMSAVYDASGIVGIFLASAATLMAGATHWRQLFWVGALIGLIGALLQAHAAEPVDFEPTKLRWSVLWEHWRALLAVIFVTGFTYGHYYLVTVFLNGILPLVSHVTAEQALMLNTHLLWVDVVLLLGVGLVAHKISRVGLMQAAIIATAICVVPLYALCGGASLARVTVLRFFLIFLGSAFAVPYHAWKLDVLPRRHRLFVGALGVSIGSKFLGAPMPALATYLVDYTGWVGAAGVPMVGLCLLALCSLGFKETSDNRC